MIPTPTRAPLEEGHRAAPRDDEHELEAWVADVRARRPTVGLAAAIVREGEPVSFRGAGLADIACARPITSDTVFRVGSVTKTMTAVAVMQLRERGAIDLDAPANEYLQAYRLIPAQGSCRSATVRHLLTHTSGIPDALRFRDLLHPGWGPFDARPPILSVPAGEPLPSLAEHYEGRLRQVAEPGSDFAYSGHGFATLGQIVEDVSGMPLARYLREHVFEPLGMTDTDLVRSERVAARLARGYVLGPKGPKTAPDREWIGAGGGGVYASTRDMARYAAALLGRGANEHGRVLEPATLAQMFEPHYRTDPRLVALGLGFFTAQWGGHRIVGHDGILPGFNTGLIVAPDDAVAVIGLTNGSSGAMVWLPNELEGLLRRLLGIPDDTVRDDVPQHPEVWGDVCGIYRLSRVGDLRGRLAMGGGVQVLVRGGRLMARVLTPVPVLYRGFPLHHDDPMDPRVFRLDLSRLGMPAVRVVFCREPGTGMRVAHTDLGGQPISLYEWPALRWRHPRRWSWEERSS